MRLISNKGVPQHYSFDVNFSNGLGEGGEVIAKWVRLFVQPRSTG